MATDLKIMVVAGEASGDSHAAALISSLRELSPDIKSEFFGAAGPKMRLAGVDSVVDSDDFAIVGLAEIAQALPMFLNAFKKLKRSASVKRPDVVILVDFPEFNLKLAKALKRQGLRVIYYISPQLWAWRKYRVSAVRKYVDLMLTILPFEKDWYAAHGVPQVEYVGNPLAKEVYSTVGKEEFCGIHDLDSTRPIISLLPGSRQTEITKILPVMLAGAGLILNERSDVQFVIAAAGAKARDRIEAILNKESMSGVRLPEKLVVVEAQTYDALNASDAAAVTSGTATLETGMIGTPLVIVYRGSKVNYKLLRPLINVEHFGLINLIAEKRIAKEMIQDDFTAEALSVELIRLIEPSTNLAVREDLAIAVEKLGDGGASKKAAEAILRFLA